MKFFGLIAFNPSIQCVKNCKKIGKVRYTNECLNKCNYSKSATQIYSFEFNDEIFCLSKDQCYNIGKYPIYNIYSCSN